MVLIPLMPAHEMQEQEGRVQGLLQLQISLGSAWTTREPVSKIFFIFF